MSQSRIHSFIEAWTGTAVGFVVSMALCFVVYPLFGHTFTFAENFWITAIFTFASVIRSYAVRRIFNRLHVAKIGGAA